MRGIRRSRTRDQLAMSEHELAAMTEDLDQIHRDVGAPAMEAAAAEWRDRIRTSRRRFLVGAGAAAGGALLAACSTSTSASSTTAAGSSAAPKGTAKGSLTGDLAVAALAASLENLGVAAYKKTLAAASAGTLGTVPPAVATFVKTAMHQHAQHAHAWNSVITAAGHAAVTETDPALTPMVNHQLARVTDVAGAAKLALTLENTAAQTYQAGIAALTADSAVKVAASIQPVEMQHAAILHFALGQYPVPDAASPLTDARPLTDYTATRSG